MRASAADQPLVADRKAHAPAGHVVGLRQRGELHRDVDGARHLQHRRRRIVVEVDLRVGDVRQDDEVELLRELRRPPCRSRGSPIIAVGLDG